jgi:DNA-binding CsgD family transcriptional regulator
METNAAEMRRGPERGTPRATPHFSVFGSPSERSRISFSPRETEILRLIASDLSDKEVAEVLSISQHTLRTHLSRLFQRHNVHSRAAAVAIWLLADPTRIS